MDRSVVIGGEVATVDEAILAHGGAGKASADEFRKASKEAKAQVRVYLMSLTRAPKLVFK